MSSVFNRIIHIIAFFCLLLQVKAENITLRNYVSPNTSKFQVKSLLFDKPTLPFAFVQQVNASKKHASYQYSFPKSQLTNNPDIDDSRISYALCEPNNYKKRHCKIVLRDMTKKNNKETYCNITLMAERESGKISTQLLTYPFGKDRVIFVYLENIKEENGKNAIIKFNNLRLNDCKISETQIFMDTRGIQVFENLQILTSKDSYTISSPHLCNMYNNCRIKVNAEGKIITPMYSGLNLKDAYIISSPSYSQNEGYLILNTSNIDDPKNGTLYFLDNKGLKAWKNFEYNFDGRNGPVILSASAHNTVVICSSAKANINCTTFDSEGNIKLDTTIGLSWKPPVAVGYPYPLPNDGFLLLVHESYFADYENLGDETCLYNRLYVKKIGADGKESFLPLETFGKLDNGRLSTARIFENNIGEYCVSQMSRDDYETLIEETYYFKIRIDCFTEEDIIYNENEIFYQCNV